MSKKPLDLFEKEDDKIFDPENEHNIDTLTTFQAKIDYALMEGADWVETSENIIRYFNRNTLSPKDAPKKPLLMPSGEPFFFIYKGVKVCETGKVKEIEEFQDSPMNKRVHGEEEGTVIGG